MAVFRLGSDLVQLCIPLLYMVHFRVWCGSVVGCICCGSVVVQLWLCLCGLVFNGLAVVQVWFSCGWHVLWFSCGSAVVQLWFSWGSAVVVLWFSCGSVVV